MSIKPTLWGIGLGLVLCGAACSDGELTDADRDGIADGIQMPNNVTVITPTKPLGYLAGEVSDSFLPTGLDGVTVSLFGGGVNEEATTDASGRFEFGPIAAGAAMSLRFSKEGYLPVTISGVIIDDEAGNFPTLNGATYVGTVRMLASTGKLSVQVVSSDGTPVKDASVMVESAVRYYLDTQPRSTGFSMGTTDANGMVTVAGLPNVWALPPSQTAQAALKVEVAPVDLDGDGIADLDGATLNLSGGEVRSQSGAPLIVLRPPANGEAFRVVASNVQALVGSTAVPAILTMDNSIRVVFNRSVDPDTVLVDLRNEKGDQTIPTSVVAGMAPNMLTVSATSMLVPGREYNIYFRVHSLTGTPRASLEKRAPFFIADLPEQAISVVSTFIDRNEDSMWGNSNDEMRFEISMPIGRAGRSPAFRAELFVELDLNGSGTIGDATGELPAGGMPYPSPITLSAAEPTPANGAGRSGYTRYIAPRPIRLGTPLEISAAAVNFEMRFPETRNDGIFVTTPTGRKAPAKFTGASPLMGP